MGTVEGVEGGGGGHVRSGQRVAGIGEEKEKMATAASSCVPWKKEEGGMCILNFSLRVNLSKKK